MTTAMASSSATLPPIIKLTPIEKDICKLLNDYTLHYNQTHLDIKEPLTLRITGGWVRDKLLGQGSHDLDIAINIMSGESFARGLNEYLTKHYARYGIKPHSIHKIDKNPEKSKHLETATTKLFDIEVDFVNLRAEEYTELSRIPITKFGTPEEDALRRDATLNALFYNIQENQIEDFTRKGLTDLKNGILRTPLPARKTFLDDPLRVLRLIRFASRFNFTIEDNVLKEMSNPEINAAFITKISRERVGNEMEKILIGNNPILGLSLIQQAHLENAIFFWHNDPSIIECNETSNKEQMQTIQKIYQEGILNKHLLKVIDNYQLLLSRSPILQSHILNNNTFKQNFILASSLLPFATLRIIALPKKKLNNTCYVSESIIKEGLKMNKLDAKIVSQTVENVSKHKALIKEFVQNSNSLQRSKLGTYLRSYSGHWEIVHFVALLEEFINLQSNDDHTAIELFKDYNSFYSFILDQGLKNCHEMKPLIDGKKMLKVLNMKAGPWMSELNNNIIVWQFDNPNGTEAQLLEYIKTVLPVT